MAFDIWLHLVLVFGMICQRSKTVSGLKLKRDCTSYSVGNMRVDVKNGKQGRKAWRQIKKSQIVPVAYSTSAPVIDPKILPGEELNLNIVWNDKKLSNRYLIRLESQLNWQRSNEHADLLLRLRNIRKTDKSTNMNFPCVALTNEPKRILIVEIWPVPSRHARNSRVRTSRKRSIMNQSVGDGRPLSIRRSRRSIAGKTICRNIQGQIQCSVTEIAALSIDHYIPHICNCAKPPSVQLDRLTNGSLEVRIWNLPQYAYNIDVKIRRVGLNDLVFYNVMDGTTRVNENRSLHVEGPFKSGNYVATARANCAGTAPDVMAVGTDCSRMGTEESNILEVSFESSSNAGQVNVSLLAGILAIIVATTAITFIVFSQKKCRPKKYDRSTNSGTKTVLLNSTRCSQDLTETKMCQFQSFMSTPVDEAFEGNPNSAEKIYDDEDNDSISTFKSPRALKREYLHVSKKNREKMLLYHPDDSEHEEKVNKLRSDLHAKKIILCSENFDNWRDFAEMAGDEFPEIVVILSAGLLNLCRAYHNKADGLDNVFDVMRQQRNYEYIPCVVMKKLQTLIQDNPDSSPFSLHLISFEYDDDLFEEYRNLYDFLKRTKCCFHYKLYISTQNTKEQKVHDTNLKCLIKALNG